MKFIVWAFIHVHVHVHSLCVYTMYDVYISWWHHCWLSGISVGTDEFVYYYAGSLTII